MDSTRWNERYREREWDPEREANRFLVAELAGREPDGRVLDVACGEGRNAVWLAARGWEVTAVDFSDVALCRARKLAARRGVRVDWVRADVTRFEAAPASFRLVVLLYLHVPGEERRRVLSRAAAALAPGGEVLMVGHALRNLTEGSGGPQDPEVLWNPDAIAREFGDLGLCVAEVETVTRRRETPEGEKDALDVLLRARRRTPNGCVR